MHNPRILIFFLLPGLLISCAPPKNGDTTLNTYGLQLVDSVRINYLGSLMLKDYDPESDHYLAFNEQEGEVFLIDRTGEIVRQFTLQKDGPDAINGFGLNPSFCGGNICIFADKIFTLDREGKVLNRTSIPYPHYWLVIGGHNAAFSLAEKLIYSKPESAEEGWDPQSAYRKMLEGGPMMEVLDTISGEYYPTMYFPETNAFEQELFYGYPTPLIINQGSHWFLSVSNAMEFHVYTEKEQRLVFQRTVRIPARNTYPDQPVPLEQMDTFFEKNGMIYRSPKIHRFLSLKNHFIAFYSKGVSPETKASYNISIPEERMKLMDQFPLEFAVFDSDFENRSVDISVPKSMVFFSALVDKEDYIVALKDQEYAGVEEDFHTLYKFKLVSRE